MNEDIKNHDNPPLRDIAPNKPIDQCTFCANWKCGECKCYEIARPEYAQDDTSVRGCNCFLVKLYVPLYILAWFGTVGGLCVAISQPFSLWYMLGGSALLTACRMINSWIENARRRIERLQRNYEMAQRQGLLAQGRKRKKPAGVIPPTSQGK